MGRRVDYGLAVCAPNPCDEFLVSSRLDSCRPFSSHSIVSSYVVSYHIGSFHPLQRRVSVSCRFLVPHTGLHHTTVLQRAVRIRSRRPFLVSARFLVLSFRCLSTSSSSRLSSSRLVSSRPAPHVDSQWPSVANYTWIPIHATLPLRCLPRNIVLPIIPHGINNAYA